MKKKIFILFLFVFTIVLAACTSNTSREDKLIKYQIEPKMSEAVINKYHLDFAKSLLNIKDNAKFLASNEAADNTDYYSLYISKNVNESIFKYQYDFTEELEKHIFDRENETGKGRNKNKTVSANALYLHATKAEADKICKLEVEEKNQEEELPLYELSLYNMIFNQKVLDILYGEEAVLKNLSLTYTFEKDLNASFNKTISSEYAGQLKNEKIDSKIYFEIVYLPIYVVRTKGSNPMASMIFLPIYEAFTSDGKVISNDDNGYKLEDSKINDIAKIDIAFNEDGTITDGTE